MCPESRRSIQIRESAAVENPVCARLVVTVFGLIFIIYFPRRDNVSLLRALKAISEFVVDRLLAQFINLFLSVTASAPFHHCARDFFSAVSWLLRSPTYRPFVCDMLSSKITI